MATTTPPQTPYEVRIRTWLWIRRQFPTDFTATIAELWAADPVFREASMGMERLDSGEHEEMPTREKVAAMMRHGRVMCARVRAWKENEDGLSDDL